MEDFILHVESGQVPQASYQCEKKNHQFPLREKSRSVITLWQESTREFLCPKDFSHTVWQVIPGVGPPGQTQILPASVGVKRPGPVCYSCWSWTLDLEQNTIQVQSNAILPFLILCLYISFATDESTWQISKAKTVLGTNAHISAHGATETMFQLKQYPDLLQFVLPATSAGGSSLRGGKR